MLTYVPNFVPSNIILIGAGGTGSRLMPMLAQLVRTCIRKYNPGAWLDELPIYVIDGDNVEEKNLLRQNFIEKDVGKNKATVLANRYSNAFGIDIHSFPEYFSQKSYQRMSDAGFAIKNSIIILAVDSANARRDILNIILNPRIAHGANTSVLDCWNLFFVDAGNEDSFGQVKFFTPSVICGGHSAFRRNFNEILGEKDKFDSIKKIVQAYPNQTVSEEKVSFIPIDLEYYDNLGASEQELSCAELPQTLAINAMMATLICSVVQNFLYLKPMNFDGIRFSMNGSVSTDYNTPKRWMKRNESIGNYGNINFTCKKINLDAYLPKEGRVFIDFLNESVNIFSKLGKVLNDYGDFVQKVVEQIPALVPSPIAPATESPKVELSAAGVPPLPSPTPISIPIEEVREVETVAAQPTVQQTVQPITPPRRRTRTATNTISSSPL